MLAGSKLRTSSSSLQSSQIMQSRNSNRSYRQNPTAMRQILMTLTQKPGDCIRARQLSLMSSPTRISTQMSAQGSMHLYRNTSNSRQVRIRYLLRILYYIACEQTSQEQILRWWYLSWFEIDTCRHQLWMGFEEQRQNCKGRGVRPRHSLHHWVVPIYSSSKTYWSECCLMAKYLYFIASHSI